MKNIIRFFGSILCVILICGCFSIPTVNAKTECFDAQNNESYSFCGTSLTASNVCLESRKFVFFQ